MVQGVLLMFAIHGESLTQAVASVPASILAEATPAETQGVLDGASIVAAATGASAGFAARSRC